MSAEGETTPPNEESAIAEAAASPPDQNLACWLAPEFLVVFGSIHAPEGESSGALIAGDQSLPASIRCMPVRGLDEGGRSREWSTLVVTTEDSMTARTYERVVLESGLKEGAPVDITVTELAPMISALPHLPPQTREDIYRFIFSALPPYGVRQRDMALSQRLAFMWDALRDRLPPAGTTHDAVRACVIETFMKISETAFWIRGWVHDFEAPIWRLTAISPEGERVELLDRCLIFCKVHISGRGDDQAEKYGFISYFELERPSYVSTGWTLQVENEAGTRMEVLAPEPTWGTTTVRNSIMTSIPLEVLPDESFMVNHVSPAVSQLQEQIRARALIANVTSYGEPESDPEVSIVIPLYHQIHFVEHQLAQFVADPYIKASELIYVLDSPHITRELHFMARELYRLYGVPFRIVDMEHSVGFACATNAGVSVAGGRLLMLMNSDILPDKPGWLSAMQKFYDSTPNIGALGPKLLYEDDSIQHAGLYFMHPADPVLLGSWANWHYFKGMPRDLAPANIARSVPGVTGACLMIDSDLYEQVGRFPEVYLQGDHEDSELCLRLLREGYENWYLPEAELYHLESRSYNMDLRLMLALYNRWLHSQRWGGFIEEVMTSYELPEREGPPQYREVGRVQTLPQPHQPHS